MGVEPTTRAAHEHGYHVVFATDAWSTPTTLATTTELLATFESKISDTRETVRSWTPHEERNMAR